MMTDRIALIIIFVLTINYSYSQEVVVSSSNSSKNENGLVLWSIGEVVSESIYDSNFALTQGFYQTKLYITALYNTINSDFDISIFPNPATNYLKLKCNQIKALNYLIINNNGIIVEKDIITEAETLIPADKLISGFYMLIIYRNSQMIKSFKIEKL